MTQQPYEGPLPIPQQESEFYWQKCKEHELWLRHCKQCNKVYFYPRDVCPMCFQRDTEWIKASGKGTLYTYAIAPPATPPQLQGSSPVRHCHGATGGRAHHAYQPGGSGAGARLHQSGMHVEVTFDDITEEISLPKSSP